MQVTTPMINPRLEKFNSMGSTSCYMIIAFRPIGDAYRPTSGAIGQCNWPIGTGLPVYWMKTILMKEGKSVEGGREKKKYHHG